MKAFVVFGEGIAVLRIKANLHLLCQDLQAVKIIPENQVMDGLRNLLKKMLVVFISL